MPKLRSGLSKDDSAANWGKAIRDAAASVCKAVSFLPHDERETFRARINECAELATKSLSCVDAHGVETRQGRTELLQRLEELAARSESWRPAQQ